MRIKNYFVFFLVFFLALAETSFAETYRIGEKEYPVIGIRLSKSGLTRLAHIESRQLNMLRRNFYLQAGRRIVLIEKTVRDLNGRKWGLAFVEEGIPIYVVIDRNDHYFPNSRINQLQYEIFAVTNDEFSVTAFGKTVLVGPSEIFRAEFGDNLKIDIFIPSERFGVDGKQDTKFTLDDSQVFVHDKSTVFQDASHILNSEFRITDLSEDLKQILATIAEAGDSEEIKNAVLNTFNRKFINQKSCLEVIEIGGDASVAAGLDSGTIARYLSPIDAKLGLSGRISTTTTFPEGLEFRTLRFRDKVFASGIVEIKREIIRTSCSASEASQKIIAVDTHGTTAELNSSILENIKITKSFDNLPRYRCRDEALRIINTLTDQNLSLRVAYLVLAHFTRYKGDGRMTRCPSS